MPRESFGAELLHHHARCDTDAFEAEPTRRSPPAGCVPEPGGHVFDERSLRAAGDANRGRCCQGTLTFGGCPAPTRDSLARHGGSGHDSVQRLLDGTAKVTKL